MENVESHQIPDRLIYGWKAVELPKEQTAAKRLSVTIVDVAPDVAPRAN
jgi:hypothetical protein